MHIMKWLYGTRNTREITIGYNDKTWILRFFRFEMAIKQINHGLEIYFDWS